jgi:hypothetical protein
MILFEHMNETSLADRYSRFQEISFLTKQFLEPRLSIGWILALTMGALQRQGAAQSSRRLLRTRTRIYQPCHAATDGIERDHQGRQ